MKNTKKLLLLSSILLLTGCGVVRPGNSGQTSASEGSNPYTTSSAASSAATSSQAATSSAAKTSSPTSTSYAPISTDSSVDYSSVSSSSLPVSDISSSEVISDDVSTITDLSIGGISYADNTFTITAAGSYSFSGSFSGNIVVNAGDDDDVEINLNGFTISSDTNSPILCWNANELKIKLVKGTDNFVYDNRAQKSADDDTQGNGAIYAKCDLKFTGKGSLTASAKYNNGIHTTKDLEMKTTVNNNSKVQINALNNALKGNDSVTVESGNIVAISTGGDGVKTEDTDVSSKGNQRGTFTMTGGQLDIYSCCDGIQASYNIDVHNGTDEDTGETTIPVLNIYTSNYSSYSGDVVDTGDSEFYLRTTSHETSYRYAVLFSDDSGNTTWSDATYLTSQNGGPGKTYYFYQLSKPSNVTKFKIYKFSASSTTDSESSAVACMSEYKSLNDSYDTVVFTTSSSSISFYAWTNYSSSSGQGGGPGGWGGGGWDDGNNDKSEYSAKGMKAENIISINGGVIYIKAYDDTIHANYGTSFDNGATGLGDVVIYDGSLTLYSADDGLHADRYCTINGGTIDIQNAYEGVEGNYITVAGGYTKVYSTDDGLNAANKAGLSPKVLIEGGVLDVTVYGGDVDGIDSNGTYEQTGGFVITKGGNSQMSTGLDVDSTASMSGGNFLCFGKPEKSLSTSNGISSKTYSGSYAIGTYDVTHDSTTYTVTTKYSYSALYFYSDTPSDLTVTKK